MLGGVVCCRGFLALSLCACSGSAQDVAHAINQARVHVSGHFDDHGGGGGCAIYIYDENGAINNNITGAAGFEWPHQRGKVCFICAYFKYL